MVFIQQGFSFLQRLRGPAAALALAALVGCSPMQSRHGYVPDAELVAKVRPGVHDRDSIAALFGSPTAIANFNGETWLYVSQESERIAFFDKKLRDRAVLAVRFDKSGLVSKVEQYTMADGKDVVPVTRKTATRGREITVLEQLFGNIGRFSSAAK